MANATRPEIVTGRSTIYTRGGIVCSASPVAASAGAGVMQRGGNAFDAAVAAAAVEAVTLPAACGLGGEPFVLMYNAKTGRVHGLSGSGKAPLAADRDYFVDKGYETMPIDGPLAAAIPGEVHAWASILERFGTMPLDKLLEPAIGYAEEGYVLGPRGSRVFGMAVDKLNKFPQSAKVFTRNGAAYKAGDLLVQKNLAATLKRVAKGGAEEYYKGDTARELIRAWGEAGGLYTLDELAQHETEWYEPPLSTTYRGYTIYETAPPSQGFLLLEMMNILEGYDLPGIGFYNAEAVHAMIEAVKLAYADRNAYLGDPAFVDNPLDELLSKDYGSERRNAMDPGHAATRAEPGAFATPVPGDDNTSYFCVIDDEGNALSFIHSLSHAFGSGFVAGETGITLNNRVGRGFSLVDGHPNVIEPGKRTMHTLNAYMVFKDGKPFLVSGTPGGDRQIPWNAQVLTNIIDYGMDPQQAVEAPRWVVTPGTDPATLDSDFAVELDPGMEAAEVERLRSLGHDVTVRPSVLGYGGAVQAILIDPEAGFHKAGSDPRTDGQAVAT